MRHGRQDGFTLLELLVVMLIASLMVTLVPPLFSAAVPGARLKGAAHDLTVALRHTRNQAITRNTEVAVILEQEPLQYRIAGGKPRPLPKGVKLSVEPLQGIDRSNPPQHVLWFFPDGGSSGGRITLASDAGSYQLEVDWLTGRARVVEAGHVPH
jgi:general secretion pathway protein H